MSGRLPSSALLGVFRCDCAPPRFFDASFFLILQDGGALLLDVFGQATLEAVPVILAVFLSASVMASRDLKYTYVTGFPTPLPVWLTVIRMSMNMAFPFSTRKMRSRGMMSGRRSLCFSKYVRDNVQSARSSHQVLAFSIFQFKVFYEG